MSITANTHCHSNGTVEVKLKGLEILIPIITMVGVEVLLTVLKPKLVKMVKRFKINYA
jgi:hypothetical protein